MAVEDYSRQILSSLPLQILLYFNTYYTYFNFILTLLLFVHKSYTYTYPFGAFTYEIIMIFLIFGIDNTRVFLASRGNKTEQIPPLLWSLSLSIPMFIGYSYFLTLQTYVLRVEVILNVIGLVFVGCEVLLAGGTCVGFYRGFTG